jgi:flagellar motor switch protein FliM
MEKLLTQEEIDALLRGVAEGEIETEGHKASESGTVRAYDLTNQDRIIRGRMPTMEIINDRFAREATASLFRFLGRMAEVKIEAFESIKYVDFLKKLPAPVSLNLFRTAPFRGT